MAIHASGPLAPTALVPQGAGVILGLRVRLSGSRLDARLAAGEDPYSDPVLAWDRSGYVYLADLYLNASNNTNGLYVSVAKWSAGGISFSTPPPVTRADRIRSVSRPEAISGA